MTTFYILVSAIVAACAIFLLNLILRRLFNFDIVATVPGPPSPSWIYGNMIQLVLAENYGDDEFGWHKQYGPVYRVKGCFGEDRLVVSDPQASKYILNNPAIIHSPNNARTFPVVFGEESVACVHGENHRRLRAAMNAGFSGNGVRNFLPVFVDVAKKMTSEWENVASAFIRSKANLIAEWFMAYMPDFVFRLALHLPIGPISAVHLFKHTTTKLMEDKSRDLGADFGEKSDVLSIIRAGSGFGKTGVIPSRLVHQLPVLLLAGQDTSAAALSWAFYWLAQNPEFQDKLREEILNSQEGELDYDNMPLLNALLKGTLKSKKDALLARLARKEKISDEEEHWLDNDVNDVDECALIQELETASDFERGVARLDSAKQKLLAKLNRLAGGDSDTESVKPATEKAKKRKRDPTEEEINQRASNKEKKKKAPPPQKPENATLAQRIEILN
ncbi:cytochrome P450 [Mycena leptocephala]|nr:cytochrome P450 [Mycena leptocephala]